MNDRKLPIKANSKVEQQEQNQWIVRMWLSGQISDVSMEKYIIDK